MLVDIKIDKDKIKDEVKNSEKFIKEQRRIGEEVYKGFVEHIEWLKQVSSINDFIKEKTDIGIYKSTFLCPSTLRDYFSLKLEYWYSFKERNKENFGIADNIEQILNEYKELKENDRDFFIIYSEITQENNRYFRYDKAGDYIGTQELKGEYLYEDIHINKIIEFHIYEILN